MFMTLFYLLAFIKLRNTSPMPFPLTFGGFDGDTTVLAMTVDYEGAGIIFVGKIVYTPPAVATSTLFIACL